MQYEDFAKDFIPDHGSNGYRVTFVTHEFFDEQTIIEVGMYHGRRVALKRGLYLSRELNINKLLHPTKHPNVVEFIAHVEDYVETTGLSYLLFEGIKDGLTLSKWCNQGPKLPVRQCIDLMIQLASALEYVHSRGIIHHDVKSSNILVSLDGSEPVLKLADFGLSEVVDVHGHGSEEHRYAGTHLAPEQRCVANAASHPITTKLDIYALTGIFNHIICKGRNAEEVLYIYPQELHVLTEKCSSDDPNARPTALSVLQSLRILDINHTQLQNLRAAFEEVHRYELEVKITYNSMLEQGLPIHEKLQELYDRVCKDEFMPNDLKEKYKISQQYA
jgi:serine/threonine protein kinase